MVINGPGKPPSVPPLSPGAVRRRLFPVGSFFFTRHRILIIDNDSSVNITLTSLLSNAGHHVIGVDTPIDTENFLEKVGTILSQKDVTEY